MRRLAPLGAIIGIGIFGALLTALAVWLLGGPLWGIIVGYVLGGMVYTILGALWLARIRPHADD